MYHLKLVVAHDAQAPLIMMATWSTRAFSILSDDNPSEDEDPVYCTIR